MADQTLPANSSAGETSPTTPVPETVPVDVTAPVNSGPGDAAAVVDAAQVAADAGDEGAINKESIDELLKDADPEGTKNPSIDELLQQANFEDATTVASEAPGADAESFKLPSFQQVMADAQVSSIELLRDVELNVKVELGRSRMLVEEVLKLSEGSVVELDKLAGDPVDLFVNERLVARGEVLVLNDNFCVRVNEIVAGVKEEGL